MSNQAKFLISLLFIAVIVLCAGLTRFYFDVTKNTDPIDAEANVSSIVRTCDNGMRIFESVSGCYGLLDADGAVIIEPEWMEILNVTDTMALVSKRMQDEVLIGGIDFEENVVFPFVFHSMQRITDRYYIGTVAEDESCIIYNTAFEPMFQNSWESADYENGMLALKKDGCKFSYYIAEEEPIFRKAQMQCLVGEEVLNWNISNRIYLSELTAEELLRINTCVESYISMLIRNDFTELSTISATDYFSGLSKLDCFAGFTFDAVEDFSFSASDREKHQYDYAFTILYSAEQTPTELPSDADSDEMPAAEPIFVEGSVQVHLYFQRNTANQLILTSVDLDYFNRTPQDAEQ